MTTWYVDPVAGTNSNASAGNGDSFATRRKSISNVVAAVLAPGDEIRVIADTGPTSLGINGTWTTGPQPASVGITSSTNASPIVVTLSSGNYATLAPAVGDVVVITGHSTNTNANGVWNISAIDGVSFTVTLVNADGSNSTGNGVGSGGNIRNITNACVKLASAVTKTVCLTGNKGVKTNWTASANVTCTVATSDYKEGVECQQIAVATGFTTGMAAYIALAGATDFSAYQQLSFWIKQTAGTTIVDSDITISLCSDAAGATPVNTFTLPALGQNNQWTCFTIDNAAALGSSIQSVAFNVAVDRGAQTFLLDNMIAVKDDASADSLGLNSLIGKNTTNEPWCNIQSINDTRVMLDQYRNYRPETNSSFQPYGYMGTTETVTTYKREPLPFSAQTSDNGDAQAVQDSGTLASYITISGGWNRTDMSTQTGETWIDGRNSSGRGLQVNASYINISKLNFTRYTVGIYTTTSTGVITSAATAGVGWALYNSSVTDQCDFTVDSSFGDNSPVYLFTVNDTKLTVNNLIGFRTTAGVELATSGNNTVVIGNAIHGSLAAGIKIGGDCPNIRIIGGAIKYCATVGLTYGSGFRDAYIYDTAFSNNTQGSIDVSGSYGNIYLSRCTLSDSTDFYNMPSSGATLRNAFNIYVHEEDAAADSHRIVSPVGTISSTASVRHTASGIAWKLSPTNALVTSLKPLRLKVAEVQCAASVQKTVSLYMRRDNTGLTGRLMCKGRQIAGVANDVSADMTAAIDTWEQVSISFTPTETGVVDIYAEAYGGTTYSLYVDDISAA